VPADQVGRIGAEIANDVVEQRNLLGMHCVIVVERHGTGRIPTARQAC
jgi:hypothetical protein